MGPKIYWWIIAGLVVVIGILHFVRLGWAWMIRRSASHMRSPSTTSLVSATTGEKNISHPPTQPNLLTTTRAMRALFNNYAYVRVFPLWIFSHTNAAELWWTTAYTSVVLGLTFWASLSNGVLDIANPMGDAAVMQLPLIVGLASKNNVLSTITGISYEKLNYLHRAAGRVCVLTVWIHFLQWVRNGLEDNGPGSEVFTTGVIGATALTLMFLSSFRLIRRIAYEFFLLTHIVMGIAFLVAVYAHVPNEWYQRLVWPSMFLWGLDRLVSFGRIVMVNKGWLFFTSKRVERGCIAELVSPEVVRLRVRRPMLRWQAGQHAFITMPGVARLRYEQHPFTMANIPDNSGDAVFLIRAQSGFTGRLVGRLTSTKEDINCYLDGPYGTPHNLNHYRGVLLVAGGTGVTHMLAHLAAIVKASRERTSVCSFVRLIWNVREEGAVGWIAPMLNVALAEGTGTVRVYVDIFATRSHLSDEPNTEEYPAFQHLGNVVTQVDTPETPSQTPGGSSSELSTLTSEEATEKRVQNENIVKSLRYGLSGPAVATVKFHRGRSNVEILLRTDVETVPSNWSVAVGVCGPMELMLDARRAVCTVNSAGAVFKGQPPIDLYCETFGW